MQSSAPWFVGIRSVTGNCGPACRHATAMPGTYGEWVWCDRPDADIRLVRDGRPCLWFATSRPGHGPPARQRLAPGG